MSDKMISNSTMSFSMWLDIFKGEMVKAGLPKAQADKYDNIYMQDAMRYYHDDVSISDALIKELMVSRPITLRGE